ncbi:uncharacterized protein LOC143252320 isoform X2 [Tachypleus tridentatus]|uniref:uncharacterized protein LOC143252320 isoform X2 n=1 Tax=Tachypleus tridentatus TaxID=6853 RepID=UPI003FD13FE2
MSMKSRSVGTKTVLEKTSFDCLDSVRQVLREVEERQANLELQLALALHSQRTEEVYQMLDDLSNVDKVELARVRHLVQESIQATEKEVQEQVAEKLRTKASSSSCSFGIKESPKEQKKISGSKVMQGATRKSMVRPIPNADRASHQRFIDIRSATGRSQPSQINLYHSQYSLHPQENNFIPVPEQETRGFSRRLINLSPESGLSHQTASHLGEYFPCAIPLGPPIQKRSPGFVIDQTNCIIIPSSSERRQLQEQNKVGVVNIISGLSEQEESSKQLITQVLPNINIEGRKSVTTPLNLRKENVKVVRFVEADDKSSEITPHEFSGFPSSCVNLPKPGFLSQGQRSVQTPSHNMQSHELLKNYTSWRCDPELIARIISQLSTAHSSEISVPTLSEHPTSRKGEINRDTVEKILVELIKEEFQNSSSSSEKLSPENEENYSYTSVENHSLEGANTSSSVKESLCCTLENLMDIKPSVAIQTSIQESQVRVLTPEASDQTVLSSGTLQSPSFTTKTFPPVSTPERSPPQTTCQMMPAHPSTPPPSPLNTEPVAEKSETSSCLGANVRDAAVQYSQDNTVCDSTFATTTTDSNDDPISEGELLIKKTELISGVENGEFHSTFQDLENIRDEQVGYDHLLSEGEVQLSNLSIQVLQDPVSKVLRRLSDSNGEKRFRKHGKKEIWRELSSGEIQGTEVVTGILKESGEIDVSQGEFPSVNLCRNVGYSFQNILSEGEVAAAATGDSQLLSIQYPEGEVECCFDEPKSEEHIRKVYDLTKSDASSDSLRQDYDDLDDPVKDGTSFSEGQILGSEAESLWEISPNELRNRTVISSTSVSVESL